MPVAAFKPAGVAALPSPKRFALTLALRASITSPCLAAVGYSPNTGRNSLERPERPLRFITSITPTKGKSCPDGNTEIYGGAAALHGSIAHSRAPACGCPQIRDTATIATYIAVIAI